MKNILVAVDFSSVTNSVLDTAQRLAAALSAKLWLVHAAAPDPDFVGYETGPQTVRDAVAADLRHEHRELQEKAEALRSAGLDASALLVRGPTVEVLLSEADRLSADLIVIGSHGHGALHQTLLGSVSSGVLHKARCPVTVVRQQA